MMPYLNRADAGRRLAEFLEDWAGAETIVLGLPRGGVPVAFEVARALGAQLDVFVVRKLGAPGHEELALGAIASGGVVVLNDEVIYSLQIAQPDVERIIRYEEGELQRRERLYRDGRPLPNVSGKTVLLIDDGLATGATMRAAVRALRQMFPARLVVAVPVAAAETCDAFTGEVDDIICPWTPRPFLAVGYWYRNFTQVSDQDVRDLLDASEGIPAPTPPGVGAA